MKPKKLKLDELRIRSFVTSDKVFGGDGGGASDTTTNSAKVHGSCKNNASNMTYCTLLTGCPSTPQCKNTQAIVCMSVECPSEHVVGCDCNEML